MASLTSVFTGLKLLGSDGIKGFGFLGSTIVPSAETAIPDIGEGKMNNLKREANEETIVVKQNSNKIVNVFIETDSFFDKQTWNFYKKSSKKASTDALKFRRLLKLFTVSKIDGVLIDGDSDKISVQGNGNLPTER